MGAFSKFKIFKINFIPPLGTKVGSPLTGQIVTENFYPLVSAQTTIGIGVDENLNLDELSNGSEILFEKKPAFCSVTLVATFNELNDVSLQVLSNADTAQIKLTLPSGSKGILADHEFDKLGDRKAFAQISDVEDMIAAAISALP